MEPQDEQKIVGAFVNVDRKFGVLIQEVKKYEARLAQAIEAGRNLERRVMQLEHFIKQNMRRAAPPPNPRAFSLQRIGSPEIMEERITTVHVAPVSHEIEDVDAEWVNPEAERVE